jgi:hypothetical protein
MPAAPAAQNAPSAINDVVRDVISTRRKQTTLLASAPSGMGSKTLLGSGIV